MSGWGELGCRSFLSWAALLPRNLSKSIVPQWRFLACDCATVDYNVNGQGGVYCMKVSFWLNNKQTNNTVHHRKDGSLVSMER